MIHYTISSTSEDDLNWVDWLVIGHEDEQALTQPLTNLTSSFLADRTASEEDWDWWLDEDYYDDLKVFLEEKGYKVYVTKLNWLEGVCR